MTDTTGYLQVVGAVTTDHRGWICPKCDRCLAPSQTECSYCNAGKQLLPSIPTWPSPFDNPLNPPLWNPPFTTGDPHWNYDPTILTWNDAVGWSIPDGPSYTMADTSSLVDGDIRITTLPPLER